MIASGSSRTGSSCSAIAATYGLSSLCRALVFQQRHLHRRRRAMPAARLYQERHSPHPRRAPASRSPAIPISAMWPSKTPGSMPRAAATWPSRSSCLRAEYFSRLRLGAGHTRSQTMGRTAVGTTTAGMALVVCRVTRNLQCQPEGFSAAAGTAKACRWWYATSTKKLLTECSTVCVEQSIDITLSHAASPSFENTQIIVRVVPAGC